MFLTVDVSTNSTVVHTHEVMKQTMVSLELRTELATTIYDGIEKVTGSGWSVDRFDKTYSVLQT